MKQHNRDQPHKKAIALEWDGFTAPKVTAKGSGELAEQILAIAQAHDIPLQENKQLVDLLSQLELGDEIPENLYIAVAQIIAFAYYLSDRHTVMKGHQA